ncbi:MAG: hypothetical protein KF873_18590 [Gemmataceae bacterium]|nr:hypothetical protein [Gemmataceae bacterium]
MPTLIVCSYCSARLNVPSKLQGKQISCLTCKKPIQVPGQVLALEDTIQQSNTAASLTANSTVGGPEIRVPVYEEPKASRVRTFLAQQGALTMKQYRDLRTVNVDHGNKLQFTGLTISIVRAGNTEMVHGLRIEEIDREGKVDDHTLLDIDELDEFVTAIDFIHETAARLNSSCTDYTEIEYSTKEKCRVGFYHSAKEQRAFFDVSDGRSIFLAIGKLDEIKAGIISGIDYLKTRIKN